MFMISQFRPSTVIRPQILGLLLACFLLPLAASESGDRQGSSVVSEAMGDEQVSLRLVAPIAHAQPGSDIPLMAVFPVAENWHLYWHNPGDSGMPPRLALSLPDGAEQLGGWSLPPPRHLIHAGLGTFALEGEVVVTTTLRISDDFAGDQLRLSLAANWLVCDDNLCLPGEAAVALNIPVAKHESEAVSADDPWPDLWQQHQQLAPRDLDGATLSWTDDQNLVLHLPSTLIKANESIWFASSERGWLAAGQAQDVDQGDHHLRLHLPRSRRPAPQTIAGLVVIGNAQQIPLRSFSIAIPLPPAQEP